MIPYFAKLIRKKKDLNVEVKEFIKKLPRTKINLPDYQRLNK